MYTPIAYKTSDTASRPNQNLRDWKKFTFHRQQNRSHPASHVSEVLYVFGRLDLDHTALKELPLPRSTLLNLGSRVESEVWVTRTLAVEFMHTK